MDQRPRRVAWLATGSLIALLAGAACSGPPAAVTGAAPAVPAAAAQQDGWPAYAAGFVEEYLKPQPFFAVQAGRHEYDGQMPDYSAAGIAAQVARLKEWRARVAAFDSAALNADERFEREYLLWVTDTDLYWLDRARSPFTNPVWYVDRLDPEVYLSREYAPLSQRLQGYLGYARAIPKIVADIRANLSTALPATFIERGIAAFGGFAEFYRQDVPKVFASIQDPQAQQALAEADEAAARAMDSLKAWLESERAHASGSFALGEPRFLAMLQATERVEIPVAQLAAIGHADLERNTQALKSACAQFAPQATLSACVQKMQADKPTGGAVAGARVQLDMLRAFVIAHHVVSVPDDQQAQVAEAPPYNRSNGAYISIPGPYEKGVAYTYYIASPDPSWSAAERAAYIPGKAALLYFSVHEVWPGHFLQFLHSNRNPSKIEALWVSYAYAEGWAHYSEELMWEEGLGDGNPEQHIGQLTEALLRNVRYQCAIGLHTQGMSVAQCEQMFREQAYQDSGSARQQAARGTYDPEYLKYTLGKLMIRKLRADWVARQPGAASAPDPRTYWQPLHDKFLSYGGPPIPMVRRAMVGEGGSLL
jgi:uncharacterized protein (DUF885 family)